MSIFFFFLVIYTVLLNIGTIIIIIFFSIVADMHLGRYKTYIVSLWRKPNQSIDDLVRELP